MRRLVVDAWSVARSAAIVALAACIACTKRTSHTGDAGEPGPTASTSADETGAGTASAWWRWAAERLRAWNADAGLDATSAAARQGPSAAEIRPSAEPEDPSALTAGVDADQVRDACRVLWLMRQALPPEGAEERFVGRLRALQTVLGNVQKARMTWHGPDSLRPRDLGFGIRGSVVDLVTPAGVACFFNFASHSDRLLDLRIECQAARDIAPAIQAALGPAFRAMTTYANRSSFWRVNYHWLDAWAAPRDAMSAVLGRAPDAQPPGELLAAYERLTSPLERLTVWKGSVGWGYEEAEALLKAKRYDLLRQVLRGPNPEGRAYAALALRDAGALDSSDRRTVEALRRVSPAIAVVEIPGDEGSIERADRFFSELRWPRRAQIGP